MKKLSLFFVAASVGAFLLNSCSVERRYHRSGFNVNWNNTSVKIKKDRNHQNVTDEIASEDLLVVDKKVSSASNENYTLTYSTINENSVASNSDDMSTLVNGNNAAVEALSNSSNEPSNQFTNTAVTKNKAENKADKQNRKELRKAVFKANKIFSKSNASSPEPWVYILLILLVPFGTTISMYLYEGSWTKRVTVNLILTLLCGLPGLIHALVVIFGKK